MYCVFGNKQKFSDRTSIKKRREEKDASLTCYKLFGKPFETKNNLIFCTL